MTLLEFCTEITSKNPHLLDSDHALNIRLVCPEYSKSGQEIKTYSLLDSERLFALCWQIGSSQTLHASMYPAPESFCCQYRFTDGEKTQLHTHDYIELAYIVDGEFRQKILGKDIYFSKGELCLIDKNCLHQDYLFGDKTTVLFFGIANDMFSEIMSENIATEKIISFLQSALLKQKDLQQYLHFKPNEEVRTDRHNDSELEECLLLLLRELYYNDRTGSHYIRKGLLLRIFHILSSQYDFSLSREQRKTMNWLIFEEVANYIRSNSSHVTIQQLVDNFHFQEDYFNRLIKNKTGLTYSAYVQKIRLEHAMHLLSSTDQTVEEIAQIVGYHNKGYFYKIFREKYGITPSQYRKSRNSFV